MGLSIDFAVCLERTDAEFSTINELLRSHHLPAHREPAAEVAEEIRADALVSEFQDGMGFEAPYPWLSLLRRIAMRHWGMKTGRTPPGPIAPVVDAYHDPVYRRLEEEVDGAALERMHLVLHSDCDGLYVPIDFAVVLEDEQIEGNWLGSTQRLMAELIAIGSVLGIGWRGEKPAEAEWKRVDDEIARQDPFFREKEMYRALYDAARLSLKLGTAVVFY